MEQIDFVLPWVDGSDPEWLAKKNRYRSAYTGLVAAGTNQYRDWGLLRYWFRGVEKFAPWVHKVYFVTDGQCPSWLNRDCKKLVCVTHADYIPEEYLPTFNSHVIELNLNRIPSLSGHFVYFNDDTYLLRPVRPALFFQNGLPVHPAGLQPIIPAKTNSLLMNHIYANMVYLINCHFDMKESIRQNRGKWLSLRRYGLKGYVSNMFLSQYNEAVGFTNEHMPVPVLKSVMDTVWKEEYAVLHETGTHRFRTDQDVSQYLFRYWDLASGRFVPIAPEKVGRYYALHGLSDCANLREIIEGQRTNIVCINDVCDRDSEVDSIISSLTESFEHILGEKSDFEK